MAVMQVKDMNGKDFSFDTDKICKISGDITDNGENNLTDSRRHRVLNVHDIQYVDSNGQVLDAEQVISDMSSGKKVVSALDVEAESTHSGKNHNYCIYYEDSMEKDAESFTNPFRKPMLKNHDDYSEPIGRIRQAWNGPSDLTDERSAIHTVTRVTDKDAIEKFLDGRYSTLSIGGTMGTVTCNICGKTILKDGKFKFCGHWKGETYKDQVCYWGVRDIDYNEHSVVNNPADDYAQVMKVTVITDDDKNKEKEGVGDNMGAENNQMQTDNVDETQTTPVQDEVKPVDEPVVTDAVSKREKFISMIDELLGTQTTTDAQNSEQPTEPSTSENDVTDSQETTPEPEKSVEDLKKELDEMNQKIIDLENQAQESEKKVADLEAAKAQAIEDAENFKGQCIQLAEEVKSLIADSIISKENVEDDNKETRKSELVAMSMKDLHATLDSIQTETSTQPRQVGKAQNPTLVNANEKGTVITDAQGNIEPEAKTVEDSHKKVSVQDYADDIIKKLARR